MIYVIGLIIAITFGWYAYVLYRGKQHYREAKFKTEYFRSTLIPDLRAINQTYTANIIEMKGVPQLWSEWVGDMEGFLFMVKLFTAISFSLCVIVAMYQFSPYVILLSLIPNALILGFSLTVVSHHTFLIDSYGGTINKLIDDYKRLQSEPDPTPEQRRLMDMETVIMDAVIREVSDPEYWELMKSKSFKTYVVEQGSNGK